MPFNIVLDAVGAVTLNEPVEADMTLWTGDINLGTVSGKALPLHAIANNIDTIERFGLTLSSNNFVEKQAIDATPFLEWYGEGLLQQMREMVGPNKWVLYSIGIAPNKDVTANFGIVVPLALRGREFVIACNGKPMNEASYTLDPHLAAGHWFMPTESVLACRAVFNEVDAGDYLKFTITFLGADSDKFLPLFNHTNSDLLKGLPDVPRIRRVSGPVANQTSYLNGGKTAAEGLSDLMDRYHSGSRRVLDWGVGCGRVAIHLASRPNFVFTGIDIDRDNLEWCAANLKGRYETVGLMPPIPFDDGSFDVIYSCSVLSHLTEDVAHAWLAELARVLAPDGVALLSFNGSTNLASYLGRRPLEMRRALRDGLFDTDINHDLDGFIPSKDYYRASFAETSWWSAVFQEHFDLVAIEPSVVSGYQDIAVLKRKKVENAVPTGRDSQPALRPRSEGDIENSVLIGRDGWLFLWEGSNEVSRYYIERDFFSDQAKAAWKDLLGTRVDRLDSLGARYLHLIVPDKLSVLSEHVTQPMPYLDAIPSRWFNETFESQDHYLDLLDVIASHPEKESTFYKTDSHWTALGADIAYRAICAKLGVEPVDFSDRKVVGGDMVFDLGKKLAAQPLERARFCMVQRDAVRIAENRQVRFNESPPPRDGPVKLVGTYVAFTNDAATDSRKVIIFGDSYSEYRPHLLTAMFAETFREVHFAWSTSVDFDLVQQLRPDIVITEIAERFVNVVPTDQVRTVID